MTDKANEPLVVLQLIKFLQTDFPLFEEQTRQRVRVYEPLSLAFVVLVVVVDPMSNR